MCRMTLYIHVIHVSPTESVDLYIRNVSDCPNSSMPVLTKYQHFPQILLNVCFLIKHKLLFCFVFDFFIFMFDFLSLFQINAFDMEFWCQSLRIVQLQTAF